MIRIVIIDAHPIVRCGLKQIVTEEPELKVVGEAENANKALALIRQTKCNILVLEINLPGMSGLELLKQVKHEHPKLPVLILSLYPEDQYAVRVIKAGASGYLSKDCDPSELVKAIRKVVSGGKYITSSLAEKLIFDLKASEKPLHEKLSDREFQTMCMIVSGKTLKEIAQKLCLSVKTVSTYHTRLLEKLNLRTNAELIRYAIKHRLVE